MEHSADHYLAVVVSQRDVQDRPINMASAIHASWPDSILMLRTIMKHVFVSMPADDRCPMFGTIIDMVISAYDEANEEGAAF